MPETLNLNAGKIDEVQSNLITWFEKNGREFPWRETTNPFHILIAEKLLQQTIARSSVIDAYVAIITRYPTPKDLANAKIIDLQNIIKPLGLTYRANELIIMANEIHEKHGGNIPKDLNELLSLTGVGDYSARAILAFAYNEDVPIVDTNVARFIHRILGLDESIPTNPARSKKLRDYAKELLPQGKSRRFNFAVLDLCAAVCKPRNPECSICPIHNKCVFGKTIIEI